MIKVVKGFLAVVGAVALVCCLVSCRQGLGDEVTLSLDFGAGARSIRPEGGLLAADSYEVLFFQNGAGDSLSDYLVPATGTLHEGIVRNAGKIVEGAGPVSFKLARGVYDIVVKGTSGGSRDLVSTFFRDGFLLGTDSSLVVDMAGASEVLVGSLAVTVKESEGIAGDYVLAVSKAELLDASGAVKYSSDGEAPVLAVVQGAGDVFSISSGEGNRVLAGVYSLKVTYSLTASGGGVEIGRTHFEEVAVQNGRCSAGEVVVDMSGSSGISIFDRTGIPVALTGMTVSKSAAPLEVLAQKGADYAGFNGKMMSYYHIPVPAEELKFSLVVPEAFSDGYSVTWDVVSESGQAVSITEDASDEAVARFTPPGVGVFIVHAGIVNTAQTFSAGEIWFAVDASPAPGLI